MDKSLDTTFLHYGIRKEDMHIIEELCKKNEIDFQWFSQNILKEYHTLKVNNEDFDIKNIEKILKNSLKKI